MGDAKSDYRKRLIKTINILLDSEEQFFSASVHLLMSGAGNLFNLEQVTRQLF